MTKKRFTLIVVVSVVVSLIVVDSWDFNTFYQASRLLLSGASPYANGEYYSPLHVALMYTPLALLPYSVAVRLNMALMVGVYLFALAKIFKGRESLIMMLTPFSVLIARYGNLESMLLLGALLPARWGAWALMLKPQIGLFSAAILIVKERARKTAAAIVAMLGASVLLGMGQRTPVNGWWNVAPFPYGLIIGLPLLWLAWRKRDQLMALGAALFVSPYMSFITYCAALPLFRSNRRAVLIGVVLSWAAFAVVWMNTKA